jgi:hypothetical protein
VHTGFAAAATAWRVFGGDGGVSGQHERRAASISEIKLGIVPTSLCHRALPDERYLEFRSRGVFRL